MASIGIDFGTTNSVVAVHNSSGTEVLPIDKAPIEWAPYGFDDIMPSVMARGSDSSLCFGWEAKQRATGRFDAVKRMFATDIDTSTDESGEGLAVEEVATMLFAELRRRSLDNGIDANQAVVTVPANSKGRARHRTKLCAGMAGIEVLSLINEPTAAAMAYAQKHPEARQLLVFDWGGGTLDVTILRSEEGVFIEQSSSGLPRSGGLDFDARLEKIVRESIPGLDNLSIEDRHLLRVEVELAKIRLSDADSVSIEIPGGKDFRITRSKFEQEIKGLIDESRLPLERCLGDLQVGPGSIDALVMVGGTCRIPAVRKFARDLLGVDPDPDINPMTAIAEGAAIAAAIISGELTSSDFFVSIEHSLGTFTLDIASGEHRFSEIIPRNHKLPAKASDEFSPAVKETKQVIIEVVEGDPELSVPDFTILKEFEVELPTPYDENSNRAFTIEYEYDTDGILHVLAQDIDTGIILLQDDVSYGIATDSKQLKTMSDRAKKAVTDGKIDSGAAVIVDDPESAKVIEQARIKVIPFLDSEEAAPIEDLAIALEAASGADVAAARDALKKALAPHSYLF